MKPKKANLVLYPMPVTLTQTHEIEIEMMRFAKVDTVSTNDVALETKRNEKSKNLDQFSTGNLQNLSIFIRMRRK